MRAIDGDRLKRKAQKVATEAWKMKINASVETILNEFMDWIDDSPTIEPEPHWIPCSERLPKKNGFYLCTTKDCITILEFIAGNPHYHEESSFVSDVLGKCNSYVVAWMPLPEVYREGE